jgi:hypothetical protein
MSKAPLILFIKSYSNDVHRVNRLLGSISVFNKDSIPVYICVPEKDKSLFLSTLQDKHYTLISDESILNLTLAHTHSTRRDLSGGLLQQIIKSEVWRLNICDNYVMIDSDSYFIKPFQQRDFLWTPDVPYTIMNEGRHQREWAARFGNEKFLKQFDELRIKGLELFHRQGPLFDFAPTPIVCSCKVWQTMFEKYAKPKGNSFYDQILDYPCETQWYGEFLLHDQTIPIIPREPLFKCWGFKEQWEEGQTLGETDEILAKNYLGVVEQSNWSKALDAMTPEEKKKLKWQKRWKRWTGRIKSL